MSCWAASLTKKGVIISGVIMIVMTYVGDRVDWAIMIARELETDVFYGYRLLPAPAFRGSHLT